MFDIIKELQHFLDTIHHLRKEIIIIKQCVRHIDEQIVLIELDTQEEMIDKFNINETIKQVNTISVSFQQHLRTLEKDCDDHSKKNETVQRIKTNHINCMKTSFLTVMKEYQQTQVRMKKTMQLNLFRKIIKFNPDLQELIDENDIDEVNPQFLQLVGGDEDPVIIHYLQQRHDDLISINHSIQELHEMFLSLAILIDMQKNVISSIEDTCNEIKEYVNEVNTHLQSALTLKKKVQTVCSHFFIHFIQLSQ